MPGKIKVKVLAGRNLPVMDRASDTTDAFVEIKFGSVTHKTDVCRKSLNPHWSSTEWYRFEVDESELQDEPLQLRLMDHDTYSANDAIGKVVIGLAPLLAREGNKTKNAASHGGALMSGWIPVFDTMHGIRGELNVIVKVELFADFNKYKTSSCGVQFFHCPSIPPGYRATAVHGFVEELVVNDDPEYQWIDKIRTPRASNEARQVAFIKLSNQVQRLVGVKAAELGANAVVGYQQDFDLEGEAGVVARAIGTAVNITPLPTPCQPLNIPPCTQQQLKKYLDILATDNESITDLNEYFQHHQDQLQNLLTILNPKTPAFLDEAENIDEDDKSILTRQPSIKSYSGNVSIYQDNYVSQKSLKHITEDQTDLNKLLKGNEDSDSDSSGPLQKIKKIKTNFFSRKFGSVRSRKSDKLDDQISLRSNSSDTSRISLTDIRKEFKKLKRIKKTKILRKAFANNPDEGIGMASILARSVIHAHTSLACIAETQDSEHSPSSTARRTSESEPTINMSDEDKRKINIPEIIAEPKNQNESKPKVTEMSISLKNVNTAEVVSGLHQRKLSESCPTTPTATRNENFLKLPGEAGFFGSLSLSGDSSEVYSSSEEDDESSDQKTDTEQSIETTSSVVKTVLNHPVDPELIVKMDRKLSTLRGIVPDPKELQSLYDVKIKEDDDIKAPALVSHENKSTVDKPTASETMPTKDEPVAKLNKNHHFKFHNPFTHKKVSKSISAPSSPQEDTGIVCRSSKRIKHQLSKITKSSMIKSLSHISLLPKKKQTEANPTLSQPGSSSDIISKVPSETVLGSPLLSYADLLNLDKDSLDSHKPIYKCDETSHGKVTMYIGSEPVSRASLSGPSPLYHKEEAIHHIRKDKIPFKSTGLIQTAMETILIDKVESLLVPTSPEPGDSKEKQFFDDVAQKLVRVEESRNQRSQSATTEHEIIKNIPEKKIVKDSLLHSAMDTILLDKVQSLLFPATPDEKHIVRKETARAVMPTETSGTPEDGKHNNHNERNIKMRERSTSRGKKDKHGSLFETAMKTILLDKVQTLVPATPEPLLVEQDFFEDEKHKKSRKSEDKTAHESLLHTAIETMLIEKVQTLLPSPTEPDVPNHKVQDKHLSYHLPVVDNMACDTIEIPSLTSPEVKISEKKVNITENKKESSLLQTAMEAMLIDKVQMLVSPEFEVASDKEQSMALEKPENDIIQKELIGAAVETKLLDQAQTILTSTSPVLDLKVDKLNDTQCHKGPAQESTSRGEPVSEENSILKLNDKKDKKLVRQNSVHSLTASCDSLKMSKEIDFNTVTSRKVTQNKPVLQHFHPILSGAPLETIPSLPESSLDRTESLDVEGVEESCDSPSESKCQECGSDTNNDSACGNSHAACRFDRNDREKEEWEKETGSPQHTRHDSYGGREPISTALQAQNASFNSSSAPLGIQRRSSDSDLSVTPKGGSLNALTSAVGSGGGAILRPSMNSNTLDMLEYPFLTMTEYPPGFIVHLGGTVCSRSVKLIDNDSESTTRAAWWAELRTELRAHARALRCNAVIAYSESAAICEDVCVLSASGTAAMINLDCDFNIELDTSTKEGSKTAIDESVLEPETCSIAHVPYSPGAGPYRAELSNCGGCKRARVPAVLLATCAKPNRLPAHAKAVTLTAVAARVRRAPPAAEPGARDISDQLPFLEYELHKLLLAKLRMQGANAIFSLQTQISIGERCVMALATGTAFKLTSLPPPTPPRIKASETDKDALEIQRSLWDAFIANKAANGYDIELFEPGNAESPAPNGSLPETFEIEEPPALDLSADKEACVLELDEAEDVETAKSLAMRRMHMQVYTNALKCTPAATPYAFAQVWRARLVLSGQGAGASGAAERHVARALDGVTYKLRRLLPCALVAPRFQLELPEDEIQLVVSGTAVRLVDPNKSEPDSSCTDISSNGHNTPSPPISGGTPPSTGGTPPIPHDNGTGDADDDIFTLDEEQLVKNNQQLEAFDEKNLVVNGQTPTAVSLTTLSSVAGSRAARRICALRLLFVRETTAVRELGGLSGFLHTFTCENSINAHMAGMEPFCKESLASNTAFWSLVRRTGLQEVLAIVRAYTAALGGNALTSFYITQLMLQDNAHKNQGQCLLSVGGDVVQIMY